MMIGKAAYPAGNRQGLYVSEGAGAKETLDMQIKLAAQTQQGFADGEQSFQETGIALHISDDGRVRMMAEKNMPRKGEGEPASMGSIGEPIEIEEATSLNSDFSVLWTDETESLAANMYHIENYIHHIFTVSIKDQYDGSYLIDAGYLGQALNAYGHKQHEQIADGRDTYLQSILSRLDRLDESGSNPIVNSIRAMVGTTLSNRDIDTESGAFFAEQKAVWNSFYGDADLVGNSLGKLHEDADAYFNEDTVKYGYMLEMARRSAQQDADIIASMLGEEKEHGKEKTLGEMVQKDSVEEGVLAFRHDMRVIHRIVNEDGSPLTDAQQEAAEQRIAPSVSGYNWQKITEDYLMQHPELRNVFQA